MYNEVAFNLSPSTHVSSPPLPPTFPPAPTAGSQSPTLPPPLTLLSAVQIQTAVERFLPSPTDGRLLLVCLNSAVADVLEVQRLVEGGRRQPLSTLPAQADYAALRQLYKITDAELQLPPSPSYSNAITMRIATK